MKPFGLSRQPELTVRDGAVLDLPKLACAIGPAVIVTGGTSVRGRPVWSQLVDQFGKLDVQFVDFVVSGEPSPDRVDDMARDVAGALPNAAVIAAIGGGSVIDAAKALGAALTMEGSIQRYLEGIGDRKPTGTTLPLFAVPTTAGTGSEATKNAVLSKVGPDGFKKSLRHDNFVPRAVLIDAELHVGCPEPISRASGLDAITQLLEAYVSTASNAIVDALAIKGLEIASWSFPRVLADGADVDARRAMATAAYLGGVSLANGGLGVVHGIAGPAGALRAIPHGVVCGLLIGEATEMTVENSAGVDKYRAAARALVSGSIASMVEQLREWARPLARLAEFGFTPNDVETIAVRSGNKNQPYRFSTEEIGLMIERVLE